MHYVKPVHRTARGSFVRNIYVPYNGVKRLTYLFIYYLCIAKTFRAL